MRFKPSLHVWAGTAALATCNVAHAQDNASGGGLQDIVVTAQKRSERLNDVPISVNVATGADLAARGITNASDLTKIVPGFSAAQSQFGPPVFTLRGIGFYDSSLGAKPSVSVYLDEVSIPFSIMTRGATVDLERVEVLKGPQGTLFGQNATGGAINYIASKPTEDFKTGIDLGYASFESITAGGFVSGPITPTLKARIAVRTEQGGAYQKSLTRPGDELGDRNFTTGRFLLDWTPSSAVHFQLGLNGFLDKSETPAAQLLAVIPLNPSGLPAEVAAAPLAARNNRSADWTPGREDSNDKYYQAYLRGDIDLSDSLSLTSITSYSRFDPDFLIDPDGVAQDGYSQRTTGKITAFGQEMRISGEIGGNFKFIVGGNYGKEHSYQRDDVTNSASSPSKQFAALGVPQFSDYYQFADQQIESYAAFGNIDFKLGEAVVLHGGVRYTKTDIDFSGCTADSGANTLGLALQNLYNFVVRPAAGLPGNLTIAPGTCVTLRGDPADPATFFTAGTADASLNEDNISWRAGIDYKPTSRVLLYANASKGYKSGSFPALPASDAAQYRPASQESVMAYELGFKATVLDRTAQINGALFHYDYNDKQVRGRIVANPDIFGPLEALVNVPQVRIQGAELQLDLAPTQGLRVSIAGTYVKSKIRGSFLNTDSFGNIRDFGGEPLPLTPKYQITLDGQYDWELNGTMKAFAGANLEFRSDTNGALGQTPLLDIPDYTLIDLRAGIGSIDDRYKLSLFVRNLDNTYYTTNATRVADTAVAFAGKPRTIGATFSFRY